MNLRTNSRTWTAILASAAVLLLAGAACAGDDDVGPNPQPPAPTATATATPRPEQSSPTATSPPATPPTSSPPPGGNDVLNARRTSNKQLDAAIDVLLSGDVARVIDRVKYAKVACVATPQGMGAPPKCEPGETEGAVREVFPTAQCEGSYIAPFQVPEALRTLLLNPVATKNRVLYAVYAVPADQKTNPAWPMGDYGVVFSITTTYGTTAQSVGVDKDGMIVNVRGACGGTPAQLVEYSNAKELLLPPPGR